MQRLWVYADFDWLPCAERVGRLGYESLRGNDCYCFQFDGEWLKKHGGLFLGEDLNSYPGIQYTQSGRDIFGCFSDALPDRWGRTLLVRKEQLTAKEENRLPHRLTSFDYLMGIDDVSRTGGFRFKKSEEGDFINASTELQVPPISSIRELVVASQEIERCEYENLLPERKWLMQLLHPGTSLGGARPKACVVDADNTLYMAKFPSRNDEYDMGLWEHFCHLLAMEAGINAAQTSILRTDGRYHTLLSKRFDRTANGKRIHFASAMTLLGLTDGDDANSGHGYIDIVDFILQHCTDVEHNLRELYRRVAFNICVGNSDDHFRNHGFLLRPAGWTLSPAYDMNPTVNLHQGILITSRSNNADLDELLAAHGEYMLGREVAEGIVHEVVAAVAAWKTLARQLELPPRETDTFGKRFDSMACRY